MNRGYEVGIFVLVVISVELTMMLIRQFWPNHKRRTLSEMQRYLVPLGWGFLIFVAFMLAGLWKPLEYVVAPIPAIALFVVFQRRWARRKEGI